MNKDMKSEKWDIKFLKLAAHYSEEATCTRAQVGCIIAKGNMQLSEGYNGSISGTPHCTDVGVGCLKNDEGRCVRCIHAEQNAIINAMKKGVNIEGCTAYVTHEPCESCTKLLIQAGITRIVFSKEYPNKYNQYFNQNIDWEFIDIEKPKEATGNEVSFSA